MTVPSLANYDCTTHLSLSDVAFDHLSELTALFVTIKCSKTDSFRKRVNITLGRTNCRLCPMAAIAAYIHKRGNTAGPHSCFENGETLTRKNFVSWVKSGLSAAGMEHKSYNGHSFRIGAATTVAAKGMEDSLIQTLGRWEICLLMIREDSKRTLVIIHKTFR